MKLKIFLPACLLFLHSFNPLFAQKTELLILPTIHGGHYKNVNYNFEHVRHIIQNFKPDIIAVEIRQEDMDQDTAYLKRFYNPEMIMFKNSFPEAQKAGIDNMGKDMKGKPLPLNLAQDTLNDWGKFILTNKKLMRDSAIIKARIASGMVTLKAKQGKMMGSSRASELMTGAYDLLTEEYTNTQTRVLAHTPYSYFDKFNVWRDTRIAKNIKALALKNPGKRIIVLTGANHRNRAVKLLSKVKSVHLVNEVRDN